MVRLLLLIFIRYVRVRAGMVWLGAVRFGVVM